MLNILETYPVNLAIALNAVCKWFKKKSFYLL